MTPTRTSQIHCLLVAGQQSAEGLSSSKVNVRLSAVRKLVTEAQKNGMLSTEQAANLNEVPYVSQKGIRLGNWLTKQTGLESKRVAEQKLQAIALRDSFVRATLAIGMRCPITPPKIIVEDVPSYGSYDSATNTLTTSSWEQLTEEEKGGFLKMLGPGTTEAAARAEFELGAHHCVFVHEMGHWCQACRKVPETGSGYAIEFGADRIAAAYWRQNDTSIITHQRKVFELIQSRIPDPVPAGQQTEAYFDTHYPDKFRSVLDYIWFQARMCLAVSANGRARRLSRH